MAAFSLEDGPAYIVLVAATSVVWTIKVFLIRLFLRLKINGPFGNDDWMCAVSTGFGIVYSIVTTVQVSYGLGAHKRELSARDREIIMVLAWLNQYLFFITGASSKLSGCFLIARITKTKKHLTVAYALVVAVIIWMLESLCFTAFQCRLPRPWIVTPTNGFHHQWSHALANALTSYILELALLAAAVYLVWSIKMPIITKAKVVSAFALRLIMVPPSIVRLHYLHQMLHSDRPADFTVRLEIMTLVTCQISVISATFPCAKPFFTAFLSGMMHRTRNSILPTQRSGTRNSTACGSAASGSTPRNSILLAQKTGTRNSNTRSLAVSSSTARNRTAGFQHLQLGPVKGIHSAKIEYVPSESTARMHKPSLVHTISRHSEQSVIYSRSFDVSFQDVGVLLDHPNAETLAPSREGRVRGSNAGWSWSSSKRMPSQKSKADSADTSASVEE